MKLPTLTLILLAHSFLHAKSIVQKDLFQNVIFHQKERNGKEGRISERKYLLLSLMEKTKNYPLLLKADTDPLAVTILG